MAQGILSGIGLGAVFSIGVAGAVSVLVPVTPQPAPEVGSAGTVAEPQTTATAAVAVLTTDAGDAPMQQPSISLRAPAGEELPKEPAPAALAPQVDSDVDQAVQLALREEEPVTAPTDQIQPLAPRPIPLGVIDATDAAPQVPTPVPQPQTGLADDLPPPDPLALDLTARVQDSSPVLPNPQALAPMIPDDSADVAISDTPAVPPQPDTEVAVPRTEETAQSTTDDEILIVVPDTPAPEAERQETAEAAAPAQETPAQAADTAPKPRIAAVPGTRIATLGSDARPRVGRPANTLINRDAAASDEPVETVTQAISNDPTDLPPIRRHARPFENAEGKPLMSIVLIDSGADLDASEIGLPALARFPYPVSFAVDVSLPDAFERMEQYRAEGFEVLAMLDLPQGARPSDAEVSLAVALNGLPAIVGVLEGTGEGLQGSREVADQVTGILRDSGHGLVTQSKGLNSMPKLAVKEGVPAAPVFRDFDSQNQSARVIRRFLDQAAFKAGQEGGVIMLGRLRPATIEALLVWGLADRAGSVALAPVSAVLLAQR